MVSFGSNRSVPEINYHTSNCLQANNASPEIVDKPSDFPFMAQDTSGGLSKGLSQTTCNWRNFSRVMIAAGAGLAIASFATTGGAFVAMLVVGIVVAFFAAISSKHFSKYEESVVINTQKTKGTQLAVAMLKNGQSPWEKRFGVHLRIFFGANTNCFVIDNADLKEKRSNIPLLHYALKNKVEAAIVRALVNGGADVYSTWEYEGKPVNAISLATTSEYQKILKDAGVCSCLFTQRKNS